MLGLVLLKMALSSALTLASCRAMATRAAHRSSNVVIIGGGAAGLAAALEASNSGASVYLLEKMPKVGGNSAKASSGINGALTSIQETQQVEDSYELFRTDTLRLSKDLSNPELVDILVSQSTSAIQYLIENGLPLEQLVQLGGHSVPRTHRLSSRAPIGWSLVTTLFTKASQIPNIHILTGVDVDQIILDDSDALQPCVTGVRYRNTSSAEVTLLPAGAVIISSGGSAFDQSDEGLLAEFAPHLRGMATSSGPQADGSGIKLARAIGAKLVNMDRIQIHPSGFIDPSSPQSNSKFLAPEALRGSGGLLLNARGERFANELGSRAYLADSIIAHCSPHEALLDSGREQPFAFMLLNQQAREAFGSAFTFYLQKGLFKEYPNAQELSNSLGFRSDTFLKTLSDYGAAAEAGADPFQKSTFPVASFDSNEPLFVAQITPVIHYTLGGIQIDSSTRVLSAEFDQKPIDGVFAAGESTGGVHGADRLGGNSLLECIIFGRISGREAARWVLGNKEADRLEL